MATGLAGALETLCGQAYGAQQYQKLGTKTYTAIFSLVLVCIPLSVLWMYMGKILTFIGQDPLILHEAGRFKRCLVPSLFACATLQPLVRYFQSQSLIIPMLVSSCATLVLHILLCWVLLFKSGLKNLGAAVAIDMSMWLNALFLASYMNYSPACAKTRSPLSMEVLRGIGEFFRFAVPSAVMVCLGWWSFELLVLLSGLLPNPELETSVLSICLTTTSTLYTIPYGVGAAGSTRVSNALGAGNPERARIATYAVLLIAVTEAVIISTALVAARQVFGYCFSNEGEVVDYVTDMAPLLCVSIILDNLQGVLSGVARGCGWQHLGAFVNLGAFYLFGIPIAATLGFWVKLRGRGLWIGIQAGALLQTTMLSVITSCINWEKQATKIKGFARGYRWQKTGTCINKEADYLFSIPTAIVWVCAAIDRKGLGYGIIVGASLQTSGLGIITTFTAWDSDVFLLIPSKPFRARRFAS
ncbi:Protein DETOXIFICATION 12 [Ancistrocladus abbreviatus]